VNSEGVGGQGSGVGEMQKLKVKRQNQNVKLKSCKGAKAQRSRGTKEHKAQGIRHKTKDSGQGNLHHFFPSGLQRKFACFCGIFA